MAAHDAGGDGGADGHPAGAAQPDAAADVHLGGAPPADRAEAGARRPQGRHADRAPSRDAEPHLADHRVHRARRDDHQQADVCLPERRDRAPAGADQRRAADADARPRRLPGDLRHRVGHGRARLRPRHGPGRAAAEEPCRRGRQREEALVEQAPQGVLPARRREIRLVETPARPALDEGRPPPGRLGDGDRHHPATGVRPRRG